MSRRNTFPVTKNSLLHYTTMMIPPDFVFAPVFSFCFLVAKQLYQLTASHQAPIRIKACRDIPKNPFFTLPLMYTRVKKIDCRANMKAKNSLKEQNLLFFWPDSILRAYNGIVSFISGSPSAPGIVSCPRKPSVPYHVQLI